MIYVYADGYVGLHAYPDRDDYFTITSDYTERVGELHCLLTKHFGDTRQCAEVHAEVLEVLAVVNEVLEEIEQMEEMES